MHPQSKNRKRNAKLFADARADRRDAKAGVGGGTLRKSKYAEKLAKLRAKRRT